MEASQHFAAICQALADPALYPHPVTHLERRETHISVVFLTGQWVYKLKKPVNFGFLDFSTLELRRFYCQREVVLNQRLSRNVYLEVVSIGRGADGRYRLGGPGPALEYAVKMRQLQAQASLEQQVRRRTVSLRRMALLGRLLAAFYRGAQVKPEALRFATVATVSRNVEENFRQTEEFVDSFLDRQQWSFVVQAARSFLDHHRDLFQRRLDEGRICDGHGDLRPDHVYFQDGIQIIDCIEFNDRFRYGDVAVDLAFLHMELDLMGGLQWSLPAMAAYVRSADDPAFYRLLDFYACYRAMVRVKVDAFRSRQVEGTESRRLQRSAAAYLDQAFRHAIQFNRPTLWVVCGLPASGKSTIASRLGELLELRVLQSDELRRRLAASLGKTVGVSDLDRGFYQPQWRRQVYAGLLNEAQGDLKRGASVLLDATFASSKWRREAVQLAADHDANLIFIECVCARDALQQRLAQRDSGAGPSDARLQHLDDFIRRFEPLVDAPQHCLIRIKTERPEGPLLKDLLASAYRCQCLQVRERVTPTGDT